jgi:hypothetical protein
MVWRFSCHNGPWSGGLLVRKISIKYDCSLDLILFRMFIGLIDSGIRKLNVPKVELTESWMKWRLSGLYFEWSKLSDVQRFSGPKVLTSFRRSSHQKIQCSEYSVIVIVVPGWYSFTFVSIIFFSNILAALTKKKTIKHVTSYFWFCY